MHDTETDPKEKKYTADHPEYPKLLYNHEKRTAVEVKDKDDEAKKAKEGFVEEPYPPASDVLTPDEQKQLEALQQKAAASKPGKQASATAPDKTDWTKPPAKK